MSMLERPSEQLECEQKSTGKQSQLVTTKKSALVEHVLSYEKPHEINWRSLNVVHKATNMKERKVREAFHIQKQKPGLNRDKGVEKGTTWDAILNT